jgi:hypothetical protein
LEPKNPILERFERAVELPMYLGHRGYHVTSTGKDPSRLIMVHEVSGNTLEVTKDVERGSWSYVNTRDPGDRGSLAEYLVTRDGLNPAACLERVVALGNPLARDPEGHAYREFERRAPTTLREAIADHGRHMEAETSALRTLDKLGVARGTLDEWRFGRVRNNDDLAKVVTDPPGLWASKYRPTDKRIVLTEQPIDAMAYERSRGQQTCCYMATGGSPSEAQKKKLAHVLCELPPGTKVVLAFGRDEAGRKLAAEIQALVPTVKMEREMPAFGSRWSNQMQMEQRHARSMAKPALGLGQ